MNEVNWCWSLQYPNHIIFIFRGLHDKEIEVNLRSTEINNNLTDNEKVFVEYLKSNINTYLKKEFVEMF